MVTLQNGTETFPWINDLVFNGSVPTLERILRVTTPGTPEEAYFHLVAGLREKLFRLISAPDNLGMLLYASLTGNKSNINAIITSIQLLVGNPEGKDELEAFVQALPTLQAIRDHQAKETS